ncbi:hypothetical protein UA08_05505 [Talaromyces atroroseus]|uniref:Metallo-beta-lactamase domain-containing protein n=1 Tax=Talaromyces atroroseus TaxID=1441469 RepID=A0A225AZL7_TALAT|nr:hypothetical protein UA08_05505 [Talaromyces atroroseus]OKL58967.1 hypothetical protein UA08_05505 [Talaromyces atroroseus]
MDVQRLTLDPKHVQAPTRDLPSGKSLPNNLPDAKEIKVHPRGANGEENASLYFVGTATTILAPAPSAKALIYLLIKMQRDHFDQTVEASLRRDLPIITTPHAKTHLTSKGPQDSFSNVHALDPFEQMVVDIQSSNTGKKPYIRVTGMPGKHVPTKPLQKLNDLVQAIPPTNGWMVELGHSQTESSSDFKVGYRIYISGDTLLVDELKEIPKRYAGQNIDLMLIHLGGTTVPSPSLLPMAVMVTMDAKQGLQLIQLIKPDLTIPIHYDDYDVFASPLEDFKAEIEKAGLTDRVVYLDRSDRFRFRVSG